MIELRGLKAYVKPSGGPDLSPGGPWRSLILVSLVLGLLELLELGLPEPSCLCSKNSLGMLLGFLFDMSLTISRVVWKINVLVMILTFLDFGFIGARTARARTARAIMLVLEELARYAARPPIVDELDGLGRSERCTYSWCSWRFFIFVPFEAGGPAPLWGSFHHSGPPLWLPKGLPGPLIDVSLTALLKQAWTSGTRGLTSWPRGPRSSLTASSSRVEAGCGSRSRRGKRTWKWLKHAWQKRCEEARRVQRWYYDVVILIFWSPAADVEKVYRSEEKRGRLYQWAGPLIIDGIEGAALEVGGSLLHCVIKSLSWNWTCVVVWGVFSPSPTWASQWWPVVFVGSILDGAKLHGGRPASGGLGRLDAHAATACLKADFSNSETWKHLHPTPWMGSPCDRSAHCPGLVVLSQ